MTTVRETPNSQPRERDVAAHVETMMRWSGDAGAEEPQRGEHSVWDVDPDSPSIARSGIGQT
jgi:hypothetical protein